jgi:hypothetical protein
MLTFPTLKTGSVVQYPFAAAETFGVEVLQFLAGDEQRYLTTSGSLRKWTVRLDLLDEAELKAVEQFFQSATGSFAAFSFTDPASGTVHPSCFVTTDSLTENFTGELHTGVTVLIQEGRAQPV